MKKLFIISAAAVIWMGLAGMTFAQGARIPADSQAAYSLRDTPTTLSISGGYNLGNTSLDDESANTPGSWSALNQQLSLTPPSVNRARQSSNNSKKGEFAGVGITERFNDASLMFGDNPLTTALDSKDTSNPSNQWTALLTHLDPEGKDHPKSGVLNISPIPEPGTIGLLALGLGTIYLLKRPRRQRSSLS